MEEVAQEEGMAARQGQNELPTHSQAVVPMEVDEEQAGNSSFGDKLLLVSPSQGDTFFSVSLVFDGSLSWVVWYVWNNDASTACCCEEMYCFKV